MRILIATVTAGGGHLAAAAALEEAWRTVRPNDVLQKVDVLDFASKIYRQIYVKGFVKLVEHAPEIYGMAFRKTDDSARGRRALKFRRTVAHRTNRGFEKFVKKFKPDVVLCVHYLPLEILGHMKSKEKGPHPATVCIVTDFEAHAFWLEPAVDFYCVAAEETKASLVARGAKAENIAVTGIPIAPKFSAPINGVEIRKRFGLRDDLPTMLVLGGGFGMGPLAQILAQLDKVDEPFQTLVVAGRNVELRKELASKDYKHPTHVFGFCNNMHELMSVSDLIISKPGGLTTSEAMAIGRPLLIINPIPGQETANSDFLLERGAAVKINRLDDLPYKLRQLLAPKKLGAMAAAAAALGKSASAQSVCATISERFAGKPHAKTAASTAQAR